MIDQNVVDAILLTVKLATITSVLLVVITTPLAWWLSRWHHSAKPAVLSFLSLPLVLPPTVLGFYLLIAFSPQSIVGEGYAAVTGQTLAFSFEALVIGSVIYSFPFALQPLYSGFMSFDARYLDVARSMGYRRFEAFFSVVLPLCRSSFAVAFGLSFAHTIGEFGVVLMIGGNIPGETQVLSIALYEHVEALEYAIAHKVSLILLAFSFVTLFGLYWLNNKRGAV